MNRRLRDRLDDAATEATDGAELVHPAKHRQGFGRVLVGAAAVVLLVAAVAAGLLLWDGSDDTQVVAGDNGGRVGPVVVSIELDGAHDAAIEGVIRIPAQGCVTLDTPFDQPDNPMGGIVFLHGTTWDEADQAVVLPSGERLHDGDTLSAGGGYTEFNVPSEGHITPEMVEAVASCGWGAGTVAWVQQE